MCGLDLQRKETFVVVGDGAYLCSPGCPGTCSVDQADFNFTEISTSHMLRLKVYADMPGTNDLFNIVWLGKASLNGGGRIVCGCIGHSATFFTSRLLIGFLQPGDHPGPSGGKMEQPSLHLLMSGL